MIDVAVRQHHRADRSLAATIAVGAVPIAFGTFIVPAAAPPPPTIPTLSEWAMILLGLMLGGGAVWRLRRRVAQA